jgi:hypothetical protein
VAGGSPVTALSARISGDVDVFNDREELVAPAATADAAALAELGYSVRWDRQLPGIWSGTVEGGPEGLKLEWAHDSAYRFYPAMADPQFGYVLHPADLMTNKVLAAAGRSAARDLVDIVTLSDEVPIAAAILAAVGKDPGMPPDTIMDHIAMFGRHQQTAFDRLRSAEPIDGVAVHRTIREGLALARSIVDRLEASAFGKLYLEEGRIVVPDPSRLGDYRIRNARRGGIAPRAPDVPVREVARRYRGYER